MAKLSIKAGATSQSVNIFIQDSSSTVGAGLSGLVFNTSSLIAYYTFAGANATSVQIVLATLAAVNSAYSSGGFKEIDATNMKGLYRLDIPNAALASGNGRSVTIMLGGATNMAQLALEIELTGWDNQDAVHGGMSCLPNTAVTTNASLITSGTGTDQLQVTAGLASANAKQINAVSTASVTTINANIGTTQAIAFNANNFQKVSLNDILATTLTETAGQLAAGFKKWFNVAVPTSTMNEVTLVDTLTTYTGNTPQTGDAFSRLGAPAGASVSADIAAVSAAITALNNISAATVKAQVVAAISSDTYAEPGQGTPTATIDLATKIGYLYKSLINQFTQTATTFALYNNAAAVVDNKATTSDDGTTFTRTKIVTGP